MSGDPSPVLGASNSGHEVASPRSSSTAVGGKSTSCPLCSRKTWAQQEQDLWRLERWLEHAENQFRAHERIPTNMEQLEDTVQDFRELSLDLDSHKNIVMSLNIVVNHVAEHAVTADQRAADRLRSRLAAANSRWDAVCKSAARIQGRLQSSLMQNEEYHRTIRDLVSWLERTEADIQSAEPIDLTVGNKQLKAQLTKFQDLYAQLSQFEPRVTSMREIADQVFAQSVEADSAQLRSKLAVLNDRLTSLLKICGQYKQLLDGALRNRGASVSPSTPSGLNLSGMSSPGVKSPRPSIVVLPSTESPCRSPSPRVPRASSMDERLFTSTVHSNFAAATASARTPDREEANGSAAAAAAVDTSVLQRGYRFFGRVIRTALPIQAVMLLVLGVASLVPNNNSCMDANTFVDSLEFVLGYPDGAPPT
ncbi:Muscle-specific protein [Daphnia magna]|uniref:Muscle-specific protein n=1 Tax=Daphnia magna TaxID=35525 RepID=A0A162NUG1_9CRUS|nr:Muscle-specific protein [Daphnia magna]